MTSRRDDRDSSVVLLIIGAVLVFAGVSAFLGATGWFGLWWVRSAFVALGRIGWPIALIVIGVLLIMAASNRGALARRTAGKVWRRSRSKRMIAGVLGGLADFVGMDVTVVRVLFVLLTIATNFGAGLIAYVIMALVIPEEPAVAGSQPPPAPPIPTSPPAPPAPPATPEG